MPHIAWIAVSPVKGLRLQTRSEVRVTEDGVPGDRAFFLVDHAGAMVNGKRLGALMAVEAEHEPATSTLALKIPQREPLSETVELGPEEEVQFYGLHLQARPVLGPFSAALSEHCGARLRLFAAPTGRSGVDRGRDGAVTLLSLASLERLAAEAHEREPIDPRRFRMTFGIAGLGAHEEDRWIDHSVRVGAATLQVRGNVGRCAVTTRNADSGLVDLRTLHHLSAYRRVVKSTEALPFGVHARVVEPGSVRVGDAVALQP
jgi:uncharacterized protein YcbX